MMIAIILAVALVTTVVLMSEYGWADLTGNIRNNVVFEARNKNYGAYEIRQKYSNRLFVAFIGSLAFITLAAFSPKFFPKKNNIVPAELKDSVRIKTFGEELPPEKPEEKPEEKIPENKPAETPPSGPDISTIKSTTPVASNVQQPLDTAKHDPNAVASNQNHQGTDSTGTYTPGGGGNCLDCPPTTTTTIPPTGPLEVSEVTKQAKFDYARFFQKNIRIPEEAFGVVKKAKIYVTIVLDDHGNVTQTSIKKGVLPSLDEEVKRVAASMPQWEPAEFNDKPVKVRMTIPINIILE